MNGFFVFGLIFLIITLAVYPKLQKETNYSWCPQEVRGIENNKKYFKIFLVVSIVMIIIGIIMMIA